MKWGHETVKKAETREAEALKSGNGKNKISLSEIFKKKKKNSKYTVGRCRTKRASLVCYGLVESSADYRVILGMAIRKYRMRAGYSQEALAEKVGLHRNYFGRVERGEDTIKLEPLIRVARALGVRPRVLIWSI